MYLRDRIPRSALNKLGSRMLVVLQGFDHGDLTLIHFLPLELGSFGTCSQKFTVSRCISGQAQRFDHGERTLGTFIAHGLTTLSALHVSIAKTA